jgi:hypothetical protein
MVPIPDRCTSDRARAEMAVGEKPRLAATLIIRLLSGLSVSLITIHFTISQALVQPTCLLATRRVHPGSLAS